MMFRDPVFDMMKGVAILAMILGHCRIPGILHHLIYLFHMPLFFIVSGYFFRAKPQRKVFASDARRLLLPYLVFALAVLLKYAVDGFRLNDFSTVPRFAESVLTGNFGIGPIWFLLALFWCRELFNLAANLRGGGLLSAVLSVAVGVLGLNVESSLGFSLGVSAIVFYAAGAVWAKAKWSLNGTWAVVCCMISGAAFFLCGEMDVHTMAYPMYPLNVLGALAATLLLHGILQKVSRIAPFQKALAFCGRWSLLILGVHYAEFMLFDWYAKISDPIAVAALRLSTDVLIALGLSRIPIVKRFFCAEPKREGRSATNLQ